MWSRAGGTALDPEVVRKAVSKHAAGIFGRLDLVPSDDDGRRVPAVLVAYLDS